MITCVMHLLPLSPNVNFLCLLCQYLSNFFNFLQFILQGCGWLWHWWFKYSSNNQCMSLQYFGLYNQHIRSHFHGTELTFSFSPFSHDPVFSFVFLFFLFIFFPKTCLADYNIGECLVCGNRNANRMEMEVNHNTTYNKRGPY